jgi:hypothetical protein
MAIAQVAPKETNFKRNRNLSICARRRRGSILQRLPSLVKQQPDTVEEAVRRLNEHEQLAPELRQRARG